MGHGERRPVDFLGTEITVGEGGQGRPLRTKGAEYPLGRQIIQMEYPYISNQLLESGQQLL